MRITESLGLLAHAGWRRSEFHLFGWPPPPFLWARGVTTIEHELPIARLCPVRIALEWASSPANGAPSVHAVNVDEALIRQLESSEADAATQVVDAMRSLDPSSPAATASMFGGTLVAMGPGRFVNRGLGITLDDRTPDDVIAIAQFYASRSLPAAVQVSSWSPAVTVDELTRHGFRPGWFRAMFAIDPVGAAATASPEVQIRRVGPDDIDDLLQTYGVGFAFVDLAARSISDEFARASLQLADHHTFLATIDGQIAGCGSLHVAGGVGWVGGAATLPQFRRRGVQTSLIAHRIGLARQLGCDHVGATAVPSGDSARNLLHLGFQLVQTQLVVVRGN